MYILLHDVVVALRRVRLRSKYFNYKMRQPSSQRDLIVFTANRVNLLILRALCFSVCTQEPCAIPNPTSSCPLTQVDSTRCVADMELPLPYLHPLGPPLPLHPVYALTPYFVWTTECLFTPNNAYCCLHSTTAQQHMPDKTLNLRHNLHNE